MTDKKPSDVFLELWQWRALDLTPEQFAECAGAWRQIVHLEEIYSMAERARIQRAHLEAFESRADEGVGPYAGTIERSDSDTDGPENPGDPSPAAQDDGPGAVTYDCASAPMTDPAPEEVEMCAVEMVVVDPGAKYTGYMSRLKNETRERLLRLRKEKRLTVNDILAADTYGLRWSDVMDMIEAKPVPLPRWEALAKILDQYEEAQAGG